MRLRPCILPLLLLVLLSACNTVQGVGRDVESVGRDVQQILN